jgi:hypothetical protein
VTSWRFSVLCYVSPPPVITSNCKPIRFDFLNCVLAGFHFRARHDGINDKVISSALIVIYSFYHAVYRNTCEKPDIQATCETQQNLLIFWICRRNAKANKWKQSYAALWFSRHNAHAYTFGLKIDHFLIWRFI